MASQNNEPSGAALAAMLVGGVLGVIYMALAVVALAAAFFALLITAGLTVIALMAWFKPLHIRGYEITPSMARVYVGGGLLAGGALVALLGIADFLLGLRINWNYGAWYFVIGYVAGSYLADHFISSPRREALRIPEGLELPPAAPPKAIEANQPFRFASWDDEAGR